MFDLALKAIEPPMCPIIPDSLTVHLRGDITELLTSFGAVGSLLSGELAEP